ncbi:MAG: phosphoribosyltransferase family protein, partial [bacterium]|nr:phosphoribosyltransferase family protein [bacterium]
MEDARRLFETSGAIRSGHFRFTGENHGDIYISKELLLSFPAKTQHVTALLAERCNNLLEDSIDVVVAPVDGGIIIGHSVALHLNRKTFSVFAKKGNDKFWFPAGFREKLKGKNVLIIDDVLHTGLSITRLVEVTRAAGANVLGVGVL